MPRLCSIKPSTWRGGVYRGEPAGHLRPYGAHHVNYRCYLLKLGYLPGQAQAARVYSTGDPFCNVVSASCPVANGSDDSNFYYQTAYTVQKALDPSLELSSYQGRRIPLDPALDDVIVTVYSAGSTVTSHPNSGPYHLFTNGKFSPIFTATDITNTRVAGAPNAGMLMVEIHYNYHQVLALPWMTAILPNPLPLRAYTIMPIRAAEPP